jgi:transcriptional regulator with XRE-family HTH domain
MNSKPHSDFGRMCRSLRVQRALRQREVAAAMGIKLSTYGNVESSPWKVVNREKATRLVALYTLPPDEAAALLDAWDRCPLSPGGEKRRDKWAKANALRNKAKGYDGLKLSVVELLGLHLMAMPDAEVCVCDAAMVCSVCAALERVGLDRFTPLARDRILARLITLQQELLAAVPVIATHLSPAPDEIFGG